MANLAMEGTPQDQSQAKTEKLNQAVQQQLNLESVKTRAIGLFKAIGRILEGFDAIARTNSSPKWQDILGQFSMVNVELLNIVEEIKKVSKVFVVHPKNVTAEKATILPVMLSSKLLPEMEIEDTAKREQLLLGISNLPIPTQIEKLKSRIEMIGAACESAEKVLADTRKAYGLGSRQGPTIVPTLDKVQAAKVQEQENLLRAAVNYGEGLRISGDQRNLSSVLPSHLVDVLSVRDGSQIFTDTSGMYSKNPPSSLSGNNLSTQGAVLQAPGQQLIGRSIPSPSGVSGATSFDNASTPPLPYANSPRSGTTMMNTPSPQQQTQQQQQRQKLVQHQQQLLSQQSMRPSSSPGVGLVQNTVSQIHDLQGQSQQKFQTVHGQHQMQYSQPLAHQQFQSRQLLSGHMQHNLGQNQISQANQLRSHLGQFPGTANNALFSAAQASPNSQMISNMSSTVSSQPGLPRMQQFGLPSGHPQRNHASQILSDQMFNMGTSNQASMVTMQQNPHNTQPGFGSIPTSAQNLQSGMVALQQTTQNPNYPQQRQNQQ